MKLGLSMIIKNEENNIKKYLGNIYDLFDDIVIVDTGSTDNSIKILQNFGIKIIKHEITHGDKRLIDVRNFSIEKNLCDRILVLDGDEGISREDIKKIKDYKPNKDVYGFFIKRIDHRYKDPFEDYKMCLINKKFVKFLFSVHACPQVYIRDNYNKINSGFWLNGIELHHYPEHKPYRKDYTKQLQNGIKENPGCLRYYWFLGYYYFKNNNIKKAISKFEYIINNRNTRFPVEILNSIMILSSIYQGLGDSIKSYYYINFGLEYYEEVKNDFEIKINFRIYEWFLNYQKKLIKNYKEKIIPYEFAY